MSGNGGGEPACMACGHQAARWLVTWPYGQKTGPGRLLAYCDRCREERRDLLWVAMPMSLLEIDDEAVLLQLYADGLVSTDPEAVADLLGVQGRWVGAARRMLEESQNPS